MIRSEFPQIDTVDYFWVYSELINAARHRGTVTYQELAHIVGLPLKGSYMARQTGNLLGAVSFNEMENKRPMLSALCVTVDGKVGDGFFNLARQFGLLNSEDPDDEQEFWRDQIEQTYAIWQQKFKKT